MDEGKMAEAVPIYLRAMKVLELPNPLYDEQRTTIEGMEKELEKEVKRPPSPPPVRK